MTQMQRSTFGCVQRMRKQTYRLRWTDHGKRKSETVYGSRSDANRRMAEIQLSISKESSTRPVMTVDEIFTGLYLPEAERSTAPRTLSELKRNYTKYIADQWGDYEPEDVRPAPFQKWLLTLPPATAVRCLTIMRAIMRHAVMLEVVDHSPLATTFEMPKKATKTYSHEIITGADIAAYHNAVRGSFVEAAFILGACAGLRPGEMLGVKAAEVELYATEVDGMPVVVSVVPVIRQVDDLGNIVEDADGTARLKTRQSARWAVIQEPYASRLIELRDEAIGNGYVYLTDDGTGNPIGKNAVRKEWVNLLKINKLQKVDLRNLRPTFATSMHYDHALPTEDIARLLGHVKPTITYKTYERPDKESVIKAVVRWQI